LYFSHYKVLRYNNKFLIIFFFKDYNIKKFFFNFLKKFEKKKDNNFNNKKNQVEKDINNKGYIFKKNNNFINKKNTFNVKQKFNKSDFKNKNIKKSKINFDTFSALGKINQNKIIKNSKKLIFKKKINNFDSLFDKIILNKFLIYLNLKSTSINQKSTLTTENILDKYLKVRLQYYQKKFKKKNIYKNFFLKKLKRSHKFIHYFLTNKFQYKNKSFLENKILRKKLLIVYNISLYYYLGCNRYKQFIFFSYKINGLNLRKNILNSELFLQNYIYNLINIKSLNISFNNNFLNYSPEQYKYSHNIYILFKTREIDKLIYRIKFYNFLIINIVKYIFLLYKQTFFKFSGLLKVTYLSNCCVYIYLLKSNYMTSSLISDYISRNLKVGHSLNKIVFPLLRYLYNDNKNIYLG
jgi:hypothetical protein